MRRQLDRIGFRKIRRQYLPNLSPCVWVNGFEQLIMYCAADCNGATGDCVVQQQRVDSPAQLADNLAFLFGFRMQAFACREISGDICIAATSGKATSFVSHLFGKLLVGTFWFQFLYQFQMRFLVGIVPSFAIDAEQPKVGNNKEFFVHNNYGLVLSFGGCCYTVPLWCIAGWTIVISLMLSRGVSQLIFWIWVIVIVS